MKRIHRSYLLPVLGMLPPAIPVQAETDSPIPGAAVVAAARIRQTIERLVGFGAGNRVSSMEADLARVHTIQANEDSAERFPRSSTPGETKTKISAAQPAEVSRLAHDRAAAKM